MINLNAKLKERLQKGVKKYQPVLEKVRAADINESDTVAIITDMLCDVFGFEKYIDITSEFAIKKTYCDLAVKLDNRVAMLIECKAAGLDLKDDHIRQATNYASNSGVEWAILTNGTVWKVYRILFSKPVERALVYEFDFSALNAKRDADLDLLYYLCKEAFSPKSKMTLSDLYDQKQVLNRYIIGQVLLNETVIGSACRTMKKLFPDIVIDKEQIESLIKTEVFKREILEGDSADEAAKKIQKAERAALKSAKVEKKEEKTDE